MMVVDSSPPQMTISTVSGEANSVSSFGDQEPPPPAKKKRNLPGMPDPEAEVVALSPKALMATNRFVCEICSKGFQRDQNLQLHRRGHNLPWKLKQRSSEQPRKRVYVCPELTCVHHDPARALGDLTGIKKHFSRKHGEKKWKCERCSKKYAVQSDWKAHMKTCGTREYKCDCGTLFSRRDSFITHRAFCDALAEESMRTQTLITAADNAKTVTVAVASSPPPPPLTPSTTTVVSPGNSVQSPELAENPVILPPSATMSAATTTTTTTPTSNVFASVFASMATSPSDDATIPPAAGCGGSFSSLLQAFTPSDSQAAASTTGGIMEPPPSLSLSSPPLYLSNNTTGHHQYGGYPAMSATALLQKAAQMGATTSSNPSFLCGLGLQMSSIPCQDNGTGNHRQEGGSGFGLGLGLGQSYGPTTLDFLGLGMGSTSALLNPYGNSFGLAPAAPSGRGGSSEQTWENTNSGGTDS
ncbi:Zinc finger protein GAI-ASSOCIATED FACTOR 1 [Linum grandiflorum]